MYLHRNNFYFLDESDVQNVLQKAGRQYFVGNVNFKQELDENYIDDLEIGMSLYKAFKADAPHYHQNATEYMFVVAGCYKILFLSDEREELTLKAGSFFVLPPQTPYAGKAQAGTKTFFIKHPGGNDKMLVKELDDNVKKWMHMW